MKTNFKVSIFIPIFLIFVACSGGTTANPESAATQMQEIQNSDNSQLSPYPSAAETLSPYPGLNQDGFLTENSPVELGSTIPTGTPDPILNPVIISAVENMENRVEVIYITNISDTAQDISGFSLLEPLESSHINFPQTTLDPDDSLKVYNGAENTESIDGLLWLDQPVLVEFGDSVYLLNRAGRLIWSYTKYP